MKKIAQPSIHFRKLVSFLIAFSLFIAVGCGLQTSRAQDPDYRNPNLPVERRVTDLLSRMTIEEKTAQLITLWVKKPQQLKPNNFAERGDFSPEFCKISANET